MAEHAVWSARLDAADRRLAQLQSELDIRDAVLQAAASSQATHHTTACFQTWAASLSNHASPTQHAPTSMHPTSPQQTAAAMAAVAASEAAHASAAAAQAALYAHTTVPVHPSVQPARPASPGPNKKALDDALIKEKQAQLEAALGRARKIGSLVHEQDQCLKAEVQHAKASQVAAEAAAQAMDEVLQSRQVQLAQTKAELARVYEELHSTQSAYACMQQEYQLLDNRLAECMSSQQRLESDLVYAQAQVASLKAQLAQASSHDLAHTVMSALDGTLPGHTTNKTMHNLRQEASCLASELDALKGLRSKDKASQASLQATNDNLLQDNLRLRERAARADAAVKQSEHVLRASQKLQEALATATSSTNMLKARLEATEVALAAKEVTLDQVQAENRLLKEQLLAALLRSGGSLQDALHSSGAFGRLGADLVASPRPPVHAAPARGQEAVLAGVLDRYQDLVSGLRHTQAVLVAEDGKRAEAVSAAQQRVQEAEAQLAGLQAQLMTAHAQVQEEGVRAQALASQEVHVGKARLAEVSAELAAKTTELARYKGDLASAAHMLEESRTVHAQLTEQLQRTTTELHRVTSQLQHQQQHHVGTTAFQPHDRSRHIHQPAVSPRDPTVNQPLRSMMAIPGSFPASHSSGLVAGGGQGGPMAGVEPGELRHLLDYMDQELALLEGGLADRQAISVSLKARMAAVKEAISRRQSRTHTLAGGTGLTDSLPAPPPAVPAAASHQLQHPPVLMQPALPTSSQCSPTTHHPSSSFDMGTAHDWGQHASSSRDSQLPSRPESASYVADRYQGSHTTYTVPSGGAGQSMVGRQGSAGLGSSTHATQDVRQLLADAARTVATATATLDLSSGRDSGQQTQSGSPASTQPPGARQQDQAGYGSGPSSFSSNVLHAYLGEAGRNVGRDGSRLGLAGLQADDSSALASRVMSLDNALADLQHTQPHTSLDDESQCVC